MKSRIIMAASLLAAAGAAGWLAWHGLDRDAAMRSGRVEQAPSGHGYRFIAAPGITWDAARATAQHMTWRGKRGYLATIDNAAEYLFVLDHLFPHTYPDVTYLGGRQTAPGEWRWVTGPAGRADGGKGTLFWQGDEQGAAPPGRYANWMASAFQHGGKWDVGKVCCVTIFSYHVPQFSTSLGTGDKDEGVAGYIVEFGN
jgi:hypothetical protein